MSAYYELCLFIVGRMYEILLKNNGAIACSALKYEIFQELRKPQDFDKSYATYRYRKGKYCTCRQRWEVVMDYCIDKQIKAFMLQKGRRPFDVRFDLTHDILIIMDYGYKVLDKAHPEKMYDVARNIVQTHEEQMMKERQKG